MGSAQQIDINSNVSLTAVAGLGIQRRCVVPSIVEQATAFFFCRHVWRPESRSGKPARGHHEYLPALYAMDDSDGPLANTIHAVAVVSLANAGNARGWLVDAYELHGVAIRRIRAALMDPEHVKSDQTLAAVMLLGTFEVLFAPTYITFMHADLFFC